jgi:predicted dehydrogenase
MIRVGVVGAGGIATAHLPGLAEIEGIRVIGFTDIRREVAEEAAKKFKAKAYEDYKSLARGKPDAVFLFVPAPPRAQMIKYFAGRGIHIFSEKPLALNMKDANRLVRYVERSGIKFMIGFVLHFMPPFRKIHDIVASGQIGDLITCWTRRLWHFKSAGESWYGDASKSGGMAVDYFCHDLDWVRWLGGEVRALYGKILYTTPGITSEDNTWAMLTFDKGIGIVGGSWTSRLGDNSIGAIGSKGAIFLRDGGKIVMRVDGEEEREIPLENVSPFRAEDQHFIDCLSNGATPECSIVDGMKALELSLAVQRSSREDKVIHF